MAALQPLELHSSDGARLTIHELGAHVTSWQPRDGDERLYLSGTSEFREGVAIRGGIPVIFPQFAGRGPLPKHGFARTARWTVDDNGTGRDASGAAVATMRLRESPESLAIWPHRFELQLVARAAGQTLDVDLVVHNVGDEPFTFTAALHTYVRVYDVAHTRLRGLLGNQYEDTAENGTLRTEAHDELAITGELDRVYLDVRRPIDVVEERRSTRVSATGFPDVVVWNPGARRAAAISDLEPEGWRRMICVEAAVVGSPIRLSAGERWSGAQRLTAEQ